LDADSNDSHKFKFLGIAIPIELTCKIYEKLIFKP